MGRFTSKKFEERFESYKNTPLKNHEEYKLKILENFFTELLPFLANFKSQVEVNILILDLINSYRGWRHSKGLPLRGQRTWSNASSSYRSNLILRNVKLKIAKKYYGNFSENEINMAYLAEDINSLWRVQWEQEWKVAKKKFKLAEQNSKKNPLKIDIASMSQGNIYVEPVNPKKLKANKKKRVFHKNVFTLGFDPGFTKFVMKSYDDLHKNDTVITTFSKNKQNKKTPIKKKVDVKAKLIAHQTKKKNKKTSWD